MNGFSVFEYCYRDAANFKSWGQLLLEGIASEHDAESITARLESGEFFIAEQVGVPPLYESLWILSHGPTDDDHVWHQFQGLRSVSEFEIGAILHGSVEDLLSRFKDVKMWNLERSPHRNLE